MMKTVKKLLRRYRHLLLYALFGVGTTVINGGVYYLTYVVFGLSNVLSTVLAWLVAVAFAFVTNKIWVFRRPAFRRETILYESVTFAVSRLATGLLDVAIMYVAVDVLARNAVAWKLISNVLVVVGNYLLSKFVTFHADDAGDGR